MHCCDSHLHRAEDGFENCNWAALSPSPSEQQVHSKVSLRRAVDAVQRCGVGRVRTGIRVRRSGTTCKQPVNLEVEGAEESLFTLPDYTPTVRPPPSAVDHLGETCCNVDLLSHCHRRGYGVRCGLAER